MRISANQRIYVPMRLPALIRNELVLLWRFNRYDISSTLIPGLMFMIAAWHHDQPDWTALPRLLIWGTIYFWLYCTVFCISNQLDSGEEDQQNKPDRPIPSGLVSPKGALIRWFLSCITFALVGWYLGVLEWAALWLFALILHNFGGFSRHYSTKNIIMTIGGIAQLAAAWQMVRPLNDTAWIWILLPTLTFLTHISLQDLRDIAGDQSQGRRTLPIVFGEQRSRTFLAIAFLLLPPIIHFGLFDRAGLSLGGILFDAILATLCIIIAARVLWLRHREADHVSYMLYTYWYCLLLAAAIVVL